MRAQQELIPQRDYRVVQRGPRRWWMVWRCLYNQHVEHQEPVKAALKFQRLLGSVLANQREGTGRPEASPALLKSPSGSSAIKPAALWPMREAMPLFGRCEWQPVGAAKFESSSQS